jgi:CRISPR/Cas system CSM-associated protein Csm3 (group 7 of RAMP superfamily)
MDLTLKITLESSMLPGSGSGAGAMIDNDVVFDERGIPCIPAKRIKGCLLDAALEVLEMFSVNPENEHLAGFTIENINDLFGRPFDRKKSPFTLENLFLEEHKAIHLWLDYLMAQNNSIFSVEKIKNHFTELRTSTAINQKTGVAEKHTLRTSRLLRKSLVFKGNLALDIPDDDQHRDVMLKILAFACANFKTMGTRRNRGTGDITCTLWQGKTQLLPQIPAGGKVEQ